MKFLGVLLFLVSCSAHAFLTSEHEEMRYNFFYESVQRQNRTDMVAIGADEQKLLVDALWDIQEEGKIDIRHLLDGLLPSNFELSEQLRIAVLKHRSQEAQDLSSLSAALLIALQDDEKLGALIISLRLELQDMGLELIVAAAEARYPETTDWISTAETSVGDQTALAADLWHQYLPDRGTLLFMFCRTNRSYPCMMTMRAANFAPVRLADGTLWMQPSLGMSARGYPSNQRNGHTPAGVQLIEGVMPTADQTLVYGKYRRLVLNFIPGGKDDARTKALLPATSQESKWWRPASVARDVGRNMFRIHGTGRTNSEVGMPWFPFKRTLGCVAQRENSYNGVTYKDQRNLLDILMKTQGLPVARQNETEIRGLLFVIELNDETRAVTRSDLKNMGVL